MTSRHNDTRQLRQTIAERNIFKRTGRHHEIERLVGKRQAKQVSLSESDISFSP